MKTKQKNKIKNFMKNHNRSNCTTCQYELIISLTEIGDFATIICKTCGKNIYLGEVEDVRKMHYEMKDTAKAIIKPENPYETYQLKCGECEGYLYGYENYCPSCGREIEK